MGFGMGFLGTAAVKVDQEGRKLYNPYLPEKKLGSGHSDYTFINDNPVRQEVLAHKENLISNDEKFKDCTLLLMNQTPALKTMISKGTLSRSYADQVAQVILFLKPEQITTVETMRTESEIALKRKYGKIPDDAREAKNADSAWLEEQAEDRKWDQYVNAFNFGNSNQSTANSIRRSRDDAYYERRRNRKYYDVKTSTAWLISGQTPSGSAHLALELKADGTVGTLIDRKKYPYIWEDGRLTSNFKGDHYYSLLALTEQAEHEAQLLNLPLDQCHFMMHVNVPKLQEHYQKDLNLQIVGPHHEGGTHVIMTAKLLDFKKTLLEKLDPEVPGLPHEPRFHTDSLTEGLRQASLITYEDPTGRIFLRDFSKLPHSVDGSPPLSLNEVISAQKGAYDHYYSNGLFSADSRYDRLQFRMQEYYGRHSWLPFQERKPDHHYYLRSRLLDHESITIDLANTSDFVDNDWNHALLSAFTFAEVNAESSLTEYRPKNIIFSIRGFIAPELRALSEKLGGTIENIYWDPVLNHSFRNPYLANYTTGGDSMNLIVIPYEKVKNHAQTLDLQLLKEIRQSIQTRPLSERFWSYPVFGI